MVYGYLTFIPTANSLLQHTHFVALSAQIMTLVGINDCYCIAFFIEIKESWMDVFTRLFIDLLFFFLVSNDLFHLSICYSELFLPFKYNFIGIF